MSAEALVKRIATESRACALNYTVVATSGSAGLITKPWDVARALEVAAFYALPRYLITEAAVKVFASQVFTCQFPINKLSKIIYTMQNPNVLKVLRYRCRVLAYVLQQRSEKDPLTNYIEYGEEVLALETVYVIAQVFILGNSIVGCTRPWKFFRSLFYPHIHMTKVACVTNTVRDGSTKLQVLNAHDS